MRLPGEQELDGTFGIVDYSIKPVEIGKQEGTPLVGSETAGETYREYVIPEILLDGHDLAWRIVVAGCRIRDNFLDDLDKPFLQGLPRLPNFLV